MYNSHNFTKIDNETFNLHIDTDKDYKILQLTDLHLGFGILSGKKDKLALSAVTKIIKKSRPDLIVLTGDSIFPFFPKSGTMNNGRQAKFLQHLWTDLKFHIHCALVTTTVSLVHFVIRTSLLIYLLRKILYIH